MITGCPGGYLVRNVTARQRNGIHAGLALSACNTGQIEPDPHMGAF